MTRLVGFLIWLAIIQILIIILFFVSHANSANHYTPALREVDCTLIIGQMRFLLVGDQKAGAERLFPIMDKAARKQWLKEFPFDNYDQYALERLTDYIDLGSTVTEYAAYWNLIGCEGEKPW